MKTRGLFQSRKDGRGSVAVRVAVTRPVGFLIFRANVALKKEQVQWCVQKRELMLIGK